MLAYYSQLLTAAYGGSVSDAGLNGQIIRARKLEDIVGKGC
jgi:heterodisulfide reductase subunit B|tara:strand:- start:12400 stop:12522 length:123 start_codon:yes stop_codon:yes gene_type:complete